MTSWTRVSHRLRCPICNRDSWCGIAGDIVRCMRVPSDRESPSADGMGWLHGGAKRTEWIEPPKPTKRRDWGSECDECFNANGASDARKAIASKLGVDVEAVESLRVGVWWDDYRQEQCTTWPERNARGQVVGMIRRYGDGSKLTMRGSHHGLVYRDGWDSPTGTVWIVEGGSDTAAMVSAGMAAIGRPSNTGGVNDLRKLLHRCERPIVVLGENDRKLDRRGEVPTCPKWCPGCPACWPGKWGASHVAATLAKELGRTIGWAMPPPGVKDARDWFVTNRAGFKAACERLKTRTERP